MNANEIVKRNHDIHLHTWDFSDGWHTIEELVQYALRWMKTKPWLGVSDHTPLIDRMIKDAFPDSAFNSSIRTEKSVCSSFAGGFTALQKLINSKTERYIETARSWQEKILKKYDTILLVGLEACIYDRFRRNNPIKRKLTDKETRLLAYLDAQGCDYRDREFLQGRLERFTSIPAQRIVTTFSVNRFRQTIHNNRQQR